MSQRRCKQMPIKNLEIEVEGAVQCHEPLDGRFSSKARDLGSVISIWDTGYANS